MENKQRKSSQISESLYFKNPLKDTFQLNKNCGMKRSFISTSKSKNLNENVSLDKVKIRTLPHHSNNTMDKNPNFTIVFQAIEIQRLSDQIQSQRKRLRDFQRQIINAESYEIQVKELSDKCNSLQDQITQYQEQLNKINKISEKIFQQNDSLKEKCQQIEKKLLQFESGSAQRIKSLQGKNDNPQKIYCRKSILRRPSMRLSNNFQKQGVLNKQQKSELIKLLQQSQRNLRQVNQKIFSLQKKDVDISQYQLMIQGLNKQISKSMKQNQALHNLLKQKSSQIQKWEKAALSTANGNNTFYIFQKQSPRSQIQTGTFLNMSQNKIQFSNQQKIDILSKQILRLTEVILNKNNDLLKMQQILLQMENTLPSKRISIISNQATQNNQQISSNTIKNSQLQLQVSSLRTQLQQYQTKLRQKQQQIQHMRRNQSVIYKDLEQINKLRLACENQQNLISQNLKDLQQLKISNKTYQNMLAAQRLRNSEMTLKLQQYLRKSSVSKSNYFIQSTCVNTADVPFFRNTQKLKIEGLLSRIRQLQNTVTMLRNSYNSLLNRVSGTDGAGGPFPIRFGQSRYQQ